MQFSKVPLSLIGYIVLYLAELSIKTFQTFSYLTTEKRDCTEMETRLILSRVFSDWLLVLTSVRQQPLPLFVLLTTKLCFLFNQRQTFLVQITEDCHGNTCSNYSVFYFDVFNVRERHYKKNNSIINTG